MSSGQDLMRQIASAGARMDPGLSGRDVERLVAGARQRRQRHRARRVAFAGGATCALAVTLVVMAYRRPRSPHPELAAKPRPDLIAQPQAPLLTVANQIVRLADGSTAIALDSTTEIAVAEDKNDRVELVLTRGRGRFDVKPRPSRTFTVHVGKVTVTALGTLFTVERVADRVGVAVESGTVRIDWGVGSALLEESDSGWYPPLVISGLDDRTASQELAQSPRSSPSLAAREAAATKADSAASKAESAADLLLAADKARISGHAEQGAELLRRLLREHRTDARAPLAAFTLGRMLLMELSRPLEAAAVFAEARRLAPGGPFAEDALAREVEAFSKAGVPALAHARAEEYLRLYPDGRRAAIVGVMGGIK